jgi:hypothetical protein
MKLPNIFRREKICQTKVVKIIEKYFMPSTDCLLSFPVFGIIKEKQAPSVRIIMFVHFLTIDYSFVLFVGDGIKHGL